MEHVDDISAVTEVSISGKIVGVSSVIVNYHCTNCEKKITEVELALVKCKGCDSKMLRSKCRNTLGLSIVVRDVLKNMNVTLFFANNQSYQLQSIINFPIGNEDETTTAILQFNEVLDIVFDISSKTVINVKV